MQTAEKIVDFVPEVDSGDHARYARAIKASKKARWDIDADVIRGREFDFGQKFLPDGLSRVGELEFLTESEARTTIRSAYAFGTRANNVFDFGVASRGPVSLSGNVELEGVTKLEIDLRDIETVRKRKGKESDALDDARRLLGGL